MEMELYSKINDPLSFIEKLGTWLSKSGMAGCDKVEQGMVLASACAFERKSPIQVLREYHIIEGRLSDRADAMLAKFRAKGGKHKVLARTPEEAAVELAFEDQKITSRVTFEELKGEPFVFKADGKSFKKNYATPRARMQTLWARAISDGVRTLAPEIVSGIYTPEEIEDTATPAEPKPLLTPQPAAAQTIEVQAQAEPVAAPAAEVQSSQPATPAAGNPPPPPSASPPKPFTAADVAFSPQTERLTVESLAALETAIGEGNKLKAIEWLKGRGWIKDSLSELSVERTRRILAKPEEFRSTISKGK